jgi:hypothetical protein
MIEAWRMVARWPAGLALRGVLLTPPVCALVAALLLAAPLPAAAQSDLNMYDPTLQRGSIFFPRFRPTERARPTVRRADQSREYRAPARRVLEPTLRVAPASTALPGGPLPKSDPDTFILVIGDTLAELLGSGLDDAFGDQPKTVVLRQTRPDSGLARPDFHDWPKAVREAANGEQRVSIAVMLVGANDRQPIREGDVMHEPLSERWRELYRERVDAVIAAFRERRIPLVWVGAPPMQNNRLSTDLIAVNEIFRQRVERAGGVYVDLWSGFVDSENRFNPFGPDLNGQVARLRTGDGVHFTRAGARKAAHFTDVALRRILPDLSAGPVLAAPSPPPGAVEPLPLELQPGGIERAIDQMVRAGTGLEPIAAPVIVVKPVAGPVLPLTGPALARGGGLLPNPGAARGEGAQAAEINRVFNEGRAPAPISGRADDFRWPRAP